MKPGVAQRTALAPHTAAPASRQPSLAITEADQTAPVTRPGWTLIIAFLIACAVVADRAVIGLSTGGRGALELLTFVAPAVAIVVVARYGATRTLGFMKSPVFVLAVAPYLVLTFVLPVIGVMFHRYPERTLIAVTDATTAFSFLVLGAALAGTRMRQWRPWIALKLHDTGCDFAVWCSYKYLNSGLVAVGG